MKSLLFSFLFLVASTVAFSGDDIELPSSIILGDYLVMDPDTSSAIYFLDEEGAWIAQLGCGISFKQGGNAWQYLYSSGLNLYSGRIASFVAPRFYVRFSDSAHKETCENFKSEAIDAISQGHRIEVTLNTDNSIASYMVLQ